MCQAKLECRKTKLEHYLGVSPSTISKLKVKFHLKGNVRQATKWASQEDETKKDSFLNLSPLNLGFLSLIIAAPNHAAEYRHYEGGNSDNFYVYYVSVNLRDRYHLSNMADSC